MILIVSHPGDEHARAVAMALQAAGHEPALLDLSRFPSQTTVTLGYGGADSGTMVLADTAWGHVDLARVHAVWWRRPQPFGLTPEVGDPVLRAFALAEARELFGGLWGLLPARWINDPQRDDQAHRKPYQLRVAETVGLEVPETLITNDPAAAEAFVARRGPGCTVFKAFTGTPQAWRETRLVGAAELAKLDLVRHAPVIFQEYVAGTDLRVTVVGDQVFAAEIDLAGGDYPVDFRMNYDRLRIRPTSLPPPVQAGLQALMARLGLIYGAVDFRRTDDGRHLFLEVNPAGQWLFVEHHTRQPITQAMADTLVRLDRQDPAAAATPLPSIAAPC